MAAIDSLPLIIPLSPFALSVGIRFEKADTEVEGVSENPLSTLRLRCFAPMLRANGERGLIAVFASPRVEIFVLNNTKIIQKCHISGQN